jgi:hypothetical protein
VAIMMCSSCRTALNMQLVGPSPNAQTMHALRNGGGLAIPDLKKMPFRAR